MESSGLQWIPVDSSPLHWIPLDSSPLQWTPVHSSGLQSTPVDSSPLQSTRWEIIVIKFHVDSRWTVQSSGLHSTPLHCSQTSLGGLGCGESPLESTGVHMEYGGGQTRPPKNVGIAFVLICPFQKPRLSWALCLIFSFKNNWLAALLSEWKCVHLRTVLPSWSPQK